MDKVIHSQLHLHSENFDLCRICLLEPETNRHIKFVHIFSRKNKEIKLQEHIKELFNIEVCEYITRNNYIGIVNY